MIVTNVGQGCGGRGSVGRDHRRRAGPLDSWAKRRRIRRTALRRTAKSCGPGTRCWC